MKISPSLRWILAGSLLLRALLMLARGDYMMYDEGYYLLLARSLREGHGFALNGLPHVALSPMPPALFALLSLTGLPLLLASRLVAIVAGALLVLPVAAIGRRLGGERVGATAALLTAVAPALMTFVPFFPGEAWNLYFGSEPLYLLFAFGALAAAMHADETDAPRWCIALGALAAAAFLTRGEGVIVGPMLFLLLAVRRLHARAPLRAWRGYATAALVAALCSTPYLLYLRHELGRWAISGRVQAATPSRATPAVGDARKGREERGGSVVEDFVWNGGQEAYWNAAFRLDATATRMASQYWGIARSTVGETGMPRRGSAPAAGDAERAVPRRAADAPTTRPSAPTRAGHPLRRLLLLGRGMATVVPFWLLLLAGAGFAAHRARGRVALWLSPVLVAALLPALLVYVEPRSLLPLVPMAAIGAALAIAALVARLGAAHRRRLEVALVAGAAAVLAAPALRDLARAWNGTQPLQQVASARRAVGDYLGDHLPPGSIVVSWHPAPGYFAGHDWRVLPYEPLERILHYARAQRASAIVFSRFEPSPFDHTVHPFHVLLLDPAAGAALSPSIPMRLEPVDSMPLLLVRRLVPSPRS
jgi:4-amino-4-deoxy-L-arabinose transferase-like glycosyltransferase